MDGISPWPLFISLSWLSLSLETIFDSFIFQGSPVPPFSRLPRAQVLLLHASSVLIRIVLLLTPLLTSDQPTVP